MGRLKEIFNGRHGAFLKFVVWITALFVLMMVFWPGNNVIHWIKAAVQIHRQEKEIMEYKMEIRRMDDRIRMLTSDRDTLEKFAREQFNFAEPGDDVYVIEE